MIKTAKHSRKTARPRKQTVGEVLTLGEAATFLRLSQDEVLRLITEQGLPARRLGEEWRLLKSAIEKWLSHELPDTGKAAQLAVIGAWKDDPLVDEELRETYRKRGRVPGENGQ